MCAAGVLPLIGWQYDEDKACLKDALKQEKVEFWEFYFLHRIDFGVDILNLNTFLNFILR